MIDFLRGWVINIVTLVTFIILLEILVPSGKIKKFVNLVSGFILVIAIINPFLGVMKKGIDLKEFQITSNNIIDKKEIEESSKILKDDQMKQITEVYRKKIIAQAEEAVKQIKNISNVKADVIINEDYNSKEFGAIKRICLELEVNQKDNKIKPVSKINKIQIGKNDTENTPKKEIDSALESNVQDKISKLLDVDKENIVISLMN
jgi:stage III sporulation protein AF